MSLPITPRPSVGNQYPSASAPVPPAGTTAPRSRCRPHLVHPGAPFRHVRVVVGGELDVDVVQRLELALRQLDVVGALGVDVLDPVLQQHVRRSVAAVVEQIDLPAARVVPVDVVGVREGVGRLRDLVGAVADAGRPRRVRNRVLRALVVPGVPNGRPDVLQVGEVRARSSSDFPMTSLPMRSASGRTRRSRPRRTRSWTDGLVRRGEERLLDFDAVLLGEVLLDLRPEVAVPVVDAERSALRLEATRSSGCRRRGAT